jgi:hypothetical protein
MTSYQTAVKLITVWGVKRFRASAILTVWVFLGIVSSSPLITNRLENTGLLAQ